MSDTGGFVPEQSSAYKSMQKRVAHQEFERGREEGRREILADIAKLEGPIDDFNRCWFCYEYNDPPDTKDKHKPSCLWLRAQAVKA